LIGKTYFHKVGAQEVSMRTMKKLASSHAATLVVIFVAASVTLHAQTFSLLYSFGMHSGDPAFPTVPGIIAQGRDGKMYSTSTNGGSSGVGTVFKVSPTGTLSVLYNFDVTHGAYPASGLTLAVDGNFYGTTKYGGAGGGVVFKITQGGSLTVLHQFAGDGNNPLAPPIQGANGNFYGTTVGGGTSDLGTIYEMTSTGKLTTLHSFSTSNTASPVAPLVQGDDGNFYGTAEGASPGYGSVFKITATGKLTVLHNFDLAHGASPSGQLVQGSDGNFYGTTTTGGTFGAGVIFKITPTGVFTVLHNINGSNEGNEPVAGLVQATNSNFYGVNFQGGNSADGTIFQMSAKHGYSVLHDFDGTKGEKPQVTVLQHTNGTLYGDTYEGGSTGEGVFYSLNLGLAPFITFVDAMGSVGRKVQILGQGLTGTTRVTFNGVPATTFSVLRSTYMVAVVPSGATTGPVAVTTPSGVLHSNKNFIVH
jgi:uncharacterized repeat protein (TIGR03803 family)